MDFDKCSPVIILSVIGLIGIAIALIVTRQDGFLLKAIIAILAGTAGLMLDVPEMFKGGKRG